jgi:hypothetical protein
VAVLRNGVVVGVPVNQAGDGAINQWTHQTNDTGNATWTYQVCESDGGGTVSEVCSPEVSVRI